MTGIERLRELPKGMHNHRVTVWQLTDDAYAERFGVTKHGPTIKNFLSDIADQIEREAQAPFSRVRVLAVISDMESRVSDEGGSFGALVARWARELRGAVCSGERDPAKDVSVSAYDLLPADERDAIAWVRERGGLGAVQARVDTLQDTLDWLREHAGVSKYEIVDYDELLDSLDRRLVPEGCEWPRYESGEPVRIGGAIADGLGHAHKVTSVEVFEDAAALHWNPDEPEERVWVDRGEPVRRPAKPEIDSWERIEEDARGLDSGVDRELFTHTHEDIVRRCRALAEHDAS